MKELKDMSLEELWQLFPVVLKEHNSDYALWYDEERRELLHILSGCGVCRISHIGSTSVKGLIAKPIVDILLELPHDYAADNITALLQKADWLLMAGNRDAKTLDLNKGYTPSGLAERVFHLHIKPSGDWGELYFRDYLGKHPDTAREYEELKLHLKNQYEYNRDAYTNAKSEFIIEHTQKARKEFGEFYRPTEQSPAKFDD